MAKRKNTKEETRVNYFEDIWEKLNNPPPQAMALSEKTQGELNEDHIGPYNTTIMQVRSLKYNLEEERKQDFAKGKGIRIRSQDSFNPDNTKIEDGLQSLFFGTDYADDNAYADRFSCTCGKNIGKAYKEDGIICDVCGTPTEFVDVDMKKFGWIMLDHYKTISPIYVMKLHEALGKLGDEMVLDRILASPFVDMDDEGNIISRPERPLHSKKEIDTTKHPYMEKGMLWLIKNLEEVLRFYEKTRPSSKAALFKELRYEISNIFTDSIPVFTNVLRTEIPGEKNGRSYFIKINTHYRELITTTNRINDYGRVDMSDYKVVNEVNRYLSKAVKCSEKIFEELFNRIEGKNGDIQAKLIGGRFNYSARAIITPGSGMLRAGWVIIPYIVGLEFFRYELINIYQKVTNCTPIEASSAWKRAKEEFDSVMYKCMIRYIQNNEVYCVINRNPSINVGSFARSRIVHIHPNSYNKTLTIPTTILTAMNADFDGDQINIYKIYGSKDIADGFFSMDASKTAYIDCVNGKVNPDAFLIKDEAVGFYTFNNC